MAQSILELIFKTSKQGQGGKAAAAELKELKGTVGEVSQGLLGFNAAGLTAAGVVVAAAGAVNKAVTDYQDYAEAIRGMAAITGTGVEETSRLVQAFDDMGISQEKVQSVMESAARKGFVMSIENVARLADEYNGLGTQSEKNALLTEKLGKSGLAMAKAFEQGGDAVRDLAAAQADGMIITEENIRQAEELRMAQDNLNDAWTALSNSGAKVLVPALTDVLTVVQQNIEEGLTWKNALELIGPVNTIISLSELNKARAQRESNAAGKELLEMTSPLTEGIAGVAEVTQNLATGTGSVKSGFEALPPFMQGYIDKADAARTATEKLAKKTNEELDAAMRDYNTQLQFQIASEGLSAEQKLKLAGAMGLIDEKSRYAIVKTQEWRDELEKGNLKIDEYNRKVAQLANDLQRIQSKEVTIKVNFEQGGSDPTRRVGGAVDLNAGEANGGTFRVPPGYPGDSYLVGFSSGETVTTVNDRMRATGQSGNSGGASLVIENVNINNGMDQAEFEARLTRILRKG